MTEETWVDLWREHNKKSVWTIEHIFPQGEKIPQSWVDMIAGGDKTKAKEYQETYVHKLGNLTITVFNPALGNMSFKEKLNRTDGKGHFIGYRNKLKLNEYLVGCEKWTEKEIKNRTEELVGQAMELFKWV